jgi:hypothetical protein
MLPWNFRKMNNFNTHTHTRGEEQGEKKDALRGGPQPDQLLMLLVSLPSLSHSLSDCCDIDFCRHLWHYLPLSPPWSQHFSHLSPLKMDHQQKRHPLFFSSSA